MKSIPKLGAENKLEYWAYRLVLIYTSVSVFMNLYFWENETEMA